MYLELASTAFHVHCDRATAKAISAAKNKLIRAEPRNTKNFNPEDVISKKSAKIQ
jgi:hypothetical protein